MCKRPLWDVVTREGRLEKGNNGKIYKLVPYYKNGEPYGKFFIERVRGYQDRI